MKTNKDWLLMELLHCGEYDLSLLDDVGYDWCDIISTDREFTFNINGLMRQVFSYGLSQVENAVDGRIEWLRETQENYGISDEQKEELEALEKLDVWEDFESFHNYIDTHIWCEKNKEIYQKYLQEALDDFADGTGFEIEMD